MPAQNDGEKNVVIKIHTGIIFAGKAENFPDGLEDRIFLPQVGHSAERGRLPASAAHGQIVECPNT
jgi:hypothetical protein